MMDIDIVVKERNTGSFQLGAGYSSFSGPIFNAQLNENNFLGRGQNVGLQVDYSELQKRYRLGFTEPYFYDSLWNTGFDIYRNENNIPGLFLEKVEGGSIRVGHPIYSRYFYGFLRYKLDNTKIFMRPGENATDVLNPDTANGVASSVTASMEYDKRNDRFAPSRGVHTSLSYEFSGLGGDLTYSKGDTFFRWYYNIFWNLVLRTNFSYGVVTGPKGLVPFTKKYRLGGPFNMRGFDFADIGGQQFSMERFLYLTCDPEFPGNIQCLSPESARKRANIVVGGNQQALAMIELEFPLVKQAGIRGVLFYDVGAAENRLTRNSFRQDMGFGIRWFSPMGPLRFEWGFPIDRRADLYEEASEFHFAIGTPF